MQFQQNTTVPLPVPSIISNPATGQTWLVSHQIGKGGFSQVFQIVDRATSAHYAAKIVSKSFLSSNEHLFRKLKSEIAINSSLSHPNIVQFICCFEDALNFYLVLELCPNGTLLEMIQRKKRIAQRHVQRFTANALDALEYLHGRGIIHRDVKLGNLFVDGEFRVKLGDFGLSVPLSHQGERKKTLCGTPNYIAPEVIRKEGYSFEVDIWSLGIVVYTLLVGRAPFVCASGTSEELCKVILECSIEYPRELLSSSAISLLKGMLQKDPLDRITIKEMRVHPFFENCEGKENVENQIVTGKGREKEGKLAEKEGKFTEKEGKLAEKIIQGKLAERSPLGKLTEQPPLTAKTNDPPRNQSINLQIYPQLFGKNPVESSENILNAQLQPKNIPLNTTPQKNSTLIETIAENLALLLGDCKASIKSPTSSYSKHSLPIHIVRLNELHHKKYGIFYQLSDASIGAFFNDHTAMTLHNYQSATCYYYSRLGNSKFECSHFSSKDSIPLELKKKHEIITKIAPSIEQCPLLSPVKDNSSAQQTDVILKLLYAPLPTQQPHLLIVRSKNKIVQAFIQGGKTAYLLLDEGRWLTIFKNGGLFHYNGPLRAFDREQDPETAADLHRIYKALA